MPEWRDELEQRCTQAALAPAVRDVVQREIGEHLQDRFDDVVGAGTEPEEAARVVLAEVPDVAAIRRLAQSRQQPRPPRTAVPPAEAASRWNVGAGIRDVRYAWRSFLRDRTFTAAAVGTLALCLAANLAVFAVVDAVLLRAVDVPDGDRLMKLSNQYPGSGASAAFGGHAGVPDYFDRLVAVPALTEQALFRTHGVSVGDSAAERVTGMTTTPSLFPMLRVQAALGRTFTDDESREGRNRSVILSDGLWRRRFGAAPGVIGRSLVVNGVPHEIVGVMAARFRFYDDEVTLWLPAAFTVEERSDGSRHNNDWTHVGRLGAGASREQAQAQVDALNAVNLDRFPALKQLLIDAGFRTQVDGVAATLVADVARPLQLLWAGVGCVLLIGVVNLGSLTLARAASRLNEMATRVALGADAWRVRVQLLTEHVLLAAVGGMGGGLLSVGMLRVAPWLGAALLPPGRALVLDSRVVLYGAALTLLVGVALGLAAVQAVGSATPAAALRDQGRSRTGTRAARRLRQVLVVGQVALACMLLVAAGLLFTNFRRLMAIDTGFQPSVVTGAVALPTSAYPTDPGRLAFVQRLLDGVRALPGVRAAGITTSIPFGQNRSDSVVWPEDQPLTPGKAFVSPNQITVSPGYFDAMGMPMLAGRGFDDRDVEGGASVIIIDERLARQFWPGRDAVGRSIVQPMSADALTHPSPANMRIRRVIGVVREIKQYALVTPSDAVGSYYFPTAQDVPRGFVLAVRSGAGAATVSADLRQLLARLDPRLPLFDVQVMQQRIDRSMSARRATMSLAVAFGAIALILSAVGLYGVLAYLVAQRTREIGIRMALGGSTPAIAALVLRESALVVALGLVAGLVGAMGLGRLLAFEVGDVGALDPVSVAGAVGLLAVAALVATAAPTRRALRVDPAVTLAAE